MVPGRKAEAFCQQTSNVDGAFAEYMIVDQRFTLHVPKNIDFAQAAAFMCSGTTSVIFTLDR